MKKYLLAQFDLHHRLYNNVLHGFTEEETNRRPFRNSNMNHVKYLAGHLLNSQFGLALAAGMDVKIKWNDLFAVMGQSKAKDDFPYPTLEEIQSEWNELYQPTRDALDRMTNEEFSETPPSPFDQVAESKGELWAFINHHIAYHIGQIGILRRGFGKEPMSYE